MVINVPYLFVNLVVLSGCLVYLGVLSPLMLGLTASCLIIGACTYVFPVMIANRQLRQARQAEDRLYAHIETLLSGIKELKQSRARRGEFLERWLGPAADEVCQRNIRGISIYGCAANWNRLLFFIYVGLLACWARPVLGLGPVELAGYVLVILYMMSPLEAVSNAVPHVVRADVALQHIQELGFDLRRRGTDEGMDETGRVGLRHQLHRVARGGLLVYPRRKRPAFPIGPLWIFLFAPAKSCS